MCEFRQRCRKKAEEADDISLLRGVSENQLRLYNGKGIFTLTQLSCTFRPRKRSRRVKRASYSRYAALHALAIREKKVHVYGTPNLPSKRVQVVFDAEGSEDGTFVYLLGALVVQGGIQKMHAFWANSPTEETKIFDAFLDLLDRYEDYALFHYGSYDKNVLRRISRTVNRMTLAESVLAHAVNILSVVHANLYFPTFSNGLKDIGRYLRCTWTDVNASGLQSLVWRAQWNKGWDPVWKEKLLTYNAEDCAALKTIANFIRSVCDVAQCRAAGEASTSAFPALAWADDVEFVRR